jgi:hypothetical protein
MHLIERDGTREASDDSEKSENGDEKQLETVSAESEWVNLFLNIVTDGGFISHGLGRSGQESGEGHTLLALKKGKTIIVDGGLGLGSDTSLSGLLVVKGRSGRIVDGGVDKDRGEDGLVATSRDVSEAELLGLFSERRVSLARWWGLL